MTYHSYDIKKSAFNWRIGTVSTSGILVLLHKQRIEYKTIAYNSNHCLKVIMNYVGSRMEKVSSSLTVLLLVAFGNQEIMRYRQQRSNTEWHHKACLQSTVLSVGPNKIILCFRHHLQLIYLLRSSTDYLPTIKTFQVQWESQEKK